MKKFHNIAIGLVFLFGFVYPVTLSASTIKEEIAGLYVVFFDRAADKSGMEYWENMAKTLGAQNALQTLAAGFASHPKFVSLYKGMSDKEFVEAIYKNVLGQAGDSEGISYWNGLLSSGMSRSDMVAEFVKVVLNFDKNDTQYTQTQELDKNVNKASYILQRAQERKDLFLNKVAVSLRYIETLGDKTNLSPGTDATSPDALDLDKVYLASVNVLHSITYDEATKQRAMNLLDMLSSELPNAIDIINRLKEQYGSVLQSSSTIELVSSLLKNLKQYNSNFGTIVSPVTGRTWMDRNLGASQGCISSDDVSCFGDYYQWGRYPDGHEKAQSTTTLKAASSYVPRDGKFIISSYDWTSMDDSGVSRSKSYNVCPVGFRIPTMDELLAENIKNANVAFENLKLPTAGERDRYGHFKDKTSSGYLLSVTSVHSNNYKALKYTSSYSAYNLSNRAAGVPIRCIKIAKPPRWVVSDWGSCQGGCGTKYGRQTRSVYCQDANGDVLNDSYCIDSKPDVYQYCTTKACVENNTTNSICIYSNKVTVFDNNNYVDTSSGGYSAESDNIQATLGFQGYDVLAFTDETQSGFQTALNGRNVLVMPEQENGSYANLPSQSKSAIYEFVDNGGTLIINGSISASRDTALLNELFGWSLERSSADYADYSKTNEAISTPFGNAASTLPWNNGTYTIKTSSLPAGAVKLYTNPNDSTAVFSASVGYGKVIFIAYDWFDAKPIGSQDGGWLNILDISVKTGLTCDTTPPVFTSPASASVNENQTDAITLVATDDNNVTYSIGGTDAADFDVNSTTGVVTFKVAPDYETKNSYTFTATATDTSGNATDQDVTITILDVAETVVNIVLNKSIIPLTSTVLGEPANVTDGSYITGAWYSFDYQNGQPTVSFKIDLGSLYLVRRIVLQTSQTRDYIIESSTDGVNWTVRHSVSGLNYYNDPLQDITVATPYNARYLRYTAHNQDAGYVGVIEFEVYP